VPSPIERKRMGCTHDAFRHRAGGVTGAGGIETVAGAEIAAAIDRRNCFRGVRYRLFSTARKAAFACFLFQYLLLFQVGFAWLLAATACALALELRTNRFTMTSYATREIVDLLLQRASLDDTSNDFPKRLAPGFLLWLAGVAGCIAGVSFHPCHAAMFAGGLWMLCAVKSMDQVRNAKGRAFEYVETGNGGVHLRCRRGGAAPELVRPWEDRFWTLTRFPLIYAGLAAIPLALVLFAATGDIRRLEGEEHAFTLLPLVFSLWGCALHEPARFHLVDRELDRLPEDAARMRRRLGIAERHHRDGNGGG